MSPQAIRSYLYLIPTYIACNPVFPADSPYVQSGILQVDEVKNIMVDNIERVLERGEKIELLVDKTDNLRFQVLHALLLNPCLHMQYIVGCHLPYMVTDFCNALLHVQHHSLTVQI